MQPVRATTVECAAYHGVAQVDKDDCFRGRFDHGKHADRACYDLRIEEVRHEQSC